MIKTIDYRQKILLGAFVVFMAIIGVIFFTEKNVSANPIAFPYASCGQNLNIATTSAGSLIPLATGLAVPGTSSTTGQVYMTGGTATTTCVFDSYQSDAKATQSASILVQATATGTQPTININQEFSQDGIDWYQSSTNTVPENYATSTLPISIGQVPQYTWKFGTSSLSGLFGVSGASRDTRIISLETPTRFTRVIFTLATGSPPAALWAQIVPIKQVP